MADLQLLGFLPGPVFQFVVGQGQFAGHLVKGLAQPGQLVVAFQVGLVREVLLTHGGGNVNQLAQRPEYPVFQVQEQRHHNQDGENHADDLDQQQQVDAGFRALLQHGNQLVDFVGVLLDGRHDSGGQRCAGLMLLDFRLQPGQPQLLDLLVLQSQRVVGAAWYGAHNGGGFQPVLVTGCLGFDTGIAVGQVCSGGAGCKLECCHTQGAGLVDGGRIALDAAGNAEGSGHADDSGQDNSADRNGQSVYQRASGSHS